MKTRILVGIHKAIHDKVDPELEVYKKVLRFNNIPFIDLNSSDSDFWEQVNTVSHFIYKWTQAQADQEIANAIIPIIQYQMGKKCYPNWETSWHYDDKIKQSFLLKENGFPACDFYVFYNKLHAKRWVENISFPIVYKLKNGAGSLNVELIYNKKQAKRKIRKLFGRGVKNDNVKIKHLIKTYNYDLTKIFRHYAIKIRNNFLIPGKQIYWNKHKNYIYFQKFLPNNTFDVRVTTAGERVHAFKRFNRQNDFRASGSNNWDIDPDKIDKRMLKIAIDISKKLDFQGMAYDFLYDENKDPKIIEISYLYGGAGYPDFMNGYWDNKLIWHEGRYWPQFFEMVDFLKMPSLQCPPNLDIVTNYKKATIND